MTVTTVRSKKPNEIGRVTNMLKEPLDIRRDWRIAVSPMGLSIKAIRSVAMAYSNFCIKKPRIPKNIIVPMSNMEC